MTTKIIEEESVPPSELSDEDLIQLVVQGESWAFDCLYDRYVKTVYARMRYRIPETDAEDVTQEVFVAVIKSLHSFRGTAKFSTWLRKIMDNKVSEYYRKSSRKKEPIQVDLEHAEELGDDSNSIALEDKVLIRRALKNIHRIHREILILRYVDDMKFNEIAKHLGKSMEATKSHFRRAVDALLEELEVEHGSEK